MFEEIKREELECVSLGTLTISETGARRMPSRCCFCPLLLSCREPQEIIVRFFISKCSVLY